MSKRRAIRTLIYAFVVLALSAFGVSVSQSGELTFPDPARAVKPGYFAVKTVHDGDTIDVMMAGKTETVRLIGIDTPETKDPRKPVQCFGKAASQQTKSLLEGKSVKLEADPVSGDRDKYQRLLRFVYRDDGLFINQYLVENGYAFAYTIFPNSKLDDFRVWEKVARAQSRGLWGGCQTKENRDKRETLPE